MKHSDTIRKAAVSLLNKFEGRSNSPIAVFVSPKGAISQTKITTDRFEDLMFDIPDRLMGVYTGNCSLDWIEDDLAWMGVK
jgi:hypothetical protein